MRDPMRRAAAVLAAVAVLAVTAACDPASPAVPTAPPTGSLGTPVAGSPGTSHVPPSGTPALTPVPGGTTTTPPPGPGSTTQTGWGTIHDALPAGFPVYPGALVADPLEGAASGAFSVGSDARSVATWYQAALETAGFSTLTMSGPLEDGQIVIDSVGEPTSCHVQTTIRPLSGTTHVTVLYGADCPV